MSADFESWKAQVVHLSPRERVEPAYLLLSSLEPVAEGVEAAWDEEASRRVDEIFAGKAMGIPADTLSADLRESYP